MVNSASQALAEWKSQRMTPLLTGTASNVSGPVVSSLSDSASASLARRAPKRSTTAFLEQVRASGERLHANSMNAIVQQREAKRQQELQAERQRQLDAAVKAAQPVGHSGHSHDDGGRGYRAPSGGGDRPSKTGAYGYQAFSGRYGLRQDASNAFTDLERAYRAQFGTNFVVKRGWRSMAQEAALWAAYKAGKGPMASKPGTGVHGYGTAVDINGPMMNPNSKQHKWMRQNAAQFGWYWVGQRWGEPWHWEYYGR